MSGSPFRKIDRFYEKEMVARAKEANKNRRLVSCSILDFFQQVTGFSPTEYQKKLLLDQNQFVVARWSRQSGKSLTLAVICLYTALVQSTRIAILAPSMRQARLMIGRIESFLPRLLDHVLVGRALKGRLEFGNGSWIEAFPNNPGTVRGLTCQLILLDEANYIENDRDLYDAIVYTLLTTNGRLIATSTPGTRDSLFYDMCTNNEEYGDFSRHHVSFHDALEPNGPLKQTTLDKIGRQMKGDPWRWQREMEAEFSEDEETWFSHDMIEGSIDEKLRCVKDLDKKDREESQN